MTIGDWEWLDWANVPGLLDWIGFVLGGAGLAFAVVQLTRSRSALTAAEQALDEAREGLIRDQVIAILPTFGELAESLMNAADADSREVAKRVLLRFTVSAREAEVLLGSRAKRHPDAIRELSDARRAAIFAIDRLHNEHSQTTSQRLGDAAGAIHSVAATLSGVRAMIRNEIGTGNAK